MKTLKIAGVIALLGWAFAANAQQTPADNTTPKDPKAKAILDKLSQKNKSYSTIKADFEYTLKNEGEGLNESQKGTITLKGEKYIIELGTQQVISNGKDVWTYLKDVQEVQLTEILPDDESSMLSPHKLFTIYESGFKYVYKGQETIDGKTIDVINLYPIDAGEKPFHTVVLRVNNAASQIHSMTIKMKDGNTFAYDLTTFETNKPIADNAFEFEVPADAELIDLR